MGWTGYYAENYKNGKIDRKTECDNNINNSDYLKVLKSSMVGTTYYAAVETIKTKEVFAVIFLTSVRDGEFMYKDMDETENPYECRCPKGILKLLSPTNSEYALEWRKRCYEYHKGNESINALKNLPIGSVISMPNKGFKESIQGDVVFLQKQPPNYFRKRTWWKIVRKKYDEYIGTGYYMPSKYIKNYEIIKRGI
ncbi:hypothetical protein ACTQ2N_05060 [Ruminococcus sp. LCP21S3_E8]